MGERKVLPLPFPGNPFNPVAMTPRVHTAMTIQCQQFDRLMNVMARLAVQGFAPIAFASNAVDGLSIEIEEPSDELLQGRQLAGIFRRGDPPEQWFTDKGVKVHWFVLKEVA